MALHSLVLIWLQRNGFISNSFPLFANLIITPASGGSTMTATALRSVFFLSVRKPVLVTDVAETGNAHIWTSGFPRSSDSKVNNKKNAWQSWGYIFIKTLAANVLNNHLRCIVGKRAYEN